LDDAGSSGEVVFQARVNHLDIDNHQREPLQLDDLGISIHLRGIHRQQYRGWQIRNRQIDRWGCACASGGASFLMGGSVDDHNGVVH
jgi:hypothetical protein